MKLIPLKEINDLDEFWGGAKFREIGTVNGYENIKPEENYHEYMLFVDKANPEWMLCGSIDKWDRGNIICHVRMTLAEGSGRYTVTAKEFRRSMIEPSEEERWYYIDDEVKNTRTTSA